MANYITKEDVLNYTGINLDRIQDDDNPSFKVQSLINRVEIRMVSYLSSMFGYDFETKYADLNDENKKWFKYALLEQVLYIMNNTDIMSDSGYDPEKGIIATQGQLHNISVSRTAKNMLIKSGLWDRDINLGGNVYGWFY